MLFHDTNLFCGEHFLFFTIDYPFINSLSPLGSGLISSIPDAGLHKSILLASHNESRYLFRTLCNI